MVIPLLQLQNGKKDQVQNYFIASFSSVYYGTKLHFIEGGLHGDC